MDLDGFYRIGVMVMFAAAALTAVGLLFMEAPYGRYQREGFGPSFDAKWSWVVMESPSVFVFALVYFRCDGAMQTVPLLLFGLWQLHYLQRTFVFPLLMRGEGKRKPLMMAVLAIVFNLGNATLNALGIAQIADYPSGHATSPLFLAGVALFFFGWLVNVRADATLRNLREPGESGYKIPRGGLFERVTSPNYLGEIIEWCGFALAAGTSASLAFAVFTAANLVPRALSHRRWYREHFSDYPAERKAVIPGIL